MTRLGVAGLGWLGESLIKDAMRVPGFEVVAVEDVVDERERAVADGYGVTACGGRFERLLQDPRVDAVLICTPNNLHAAQAQMAMQSGKDILVQKPLALRFADASQTVAVAEETACLLFVDYTYRFLDTMHVLRERVGQVHALRAGFHNIYGPGAEKRWFFDPATSGGGALTDLGVHLVDLGLWLMQPESVSLAAARLADAAPVEYAADLRIQLDEVPFDISVSWNAPLAETQIFLEVETPDGTLRWENVDGSFFRFRTRIEDTVLLDRETTLREDTLRAFAAALASRHAPAIDARVYSLLDQAYGRS